jgi:uncharacterized protein (TIGR00661 family)
MARILYGIAGEGLGHATRAKAILEQLNHHDVQIVTGSRAFPYLSRFFPKVHPVSSLHIKYWNNAVSTSGTLAYNVLRFPVLLYSFIQTVLLARKFKPDLIITDYEPFTCYTGLLLGIPILSIDNQHVLDRVRTGFDRRWWWETFKLKLLTSVVIPSATEYIVTTFAFSLTPFKKTRLVPPILRKELLAISPTIGKHVLVYQTSQSNRRLLELLKRLPEQFIVYGFGEMQNTDNLTFKSFSESEFFKDIASCKAVISNGGYSLMGEALMLGKPVLSEPVRKQFEQTVNAMLLEREGFGMNAVHIQGANITEFLAHLDMYRKNLKKFDSIDKNAGVDETVAWIERLIRQAS